MWCSAYAVQMARSPASTTSAMGFVGATNGQGGASLRRYHVFDIILGSDATTASADGTILYRVDRASTNGTGVAPQVTPLDLEMGSFLGTATSNLTVNYGFVSTLMAIPCNAKCTFRWKAVRGSELISPASGGNGFGFFTPVNTALVRTLTNIMFGQE